MASLETQFENFKRDVPESELTFEQWQKRLVGEIGKAMSTYKKRVVALDVDDVLCAFTPHACNFHKKEMPEKIHYWCENTMDGHLGEGWFNRSGIVEDVEFWKTIPRLSDPKDIDFTVSYYISAFPESMYDARIHWLKENGFPDAPLICTYDKLEKCKELGVTHLIDDKTMTIEKFKGSDIAAIHFIPPYAGFEPVGDKVIYNLSEVKNYL